MQMRPISLIIYRCYDGWKGVFEVERWKGEMVERFPVVDVSPKTNTPSLYTVSSRPTGVLAKARSGLVGWFEPGSSLLRNVWSPSRLWDW